MMGIFHQPKPRHFSHRYQFIDERQEQLRLLREQLHDEGQPKAADHEAELRAKLHARFAEAARQRNARRRGATASAWQWGMIVALAATLALLLLGELA